MDIALDVNMPNSDNNTPAWLQNQGFTKLNISCEVIGDLVLFNSVEVRGNTFLEDYAKLIVKINGKNLDLRNNLNELINNFQNSSVSMFYIVKFENLCNGKYQQAESAIINNLPKLGGLIYIRNVPNSPNDEIYIRTEGIESNRVNLFAISPEEENYILPTGGAQGFQDLISTVKETEDKLISGGYKSIKDRIKILRGIYYGTTWSMDYVQMKSDGRNKGFNTYTCSNEPANPISIIGNGLFQKLYKSPEVFDNLNGIDWGHIIIGMEARLSICSKDVNFPLHGCTGLEAVTWVGDIGGGAGMLAIQRASNPNRRAIGKFKDVHNFGGWVNIEGDIAAYLIGRDNSNFEHRSNIYLTDKQYISEALKNYLLPSTMQGSEWQNRSRNFLAMIGGVLDASGNLLNETQLKNEVANKIEAFAELYISLKAYEGNVNMFEVSSHIKNTAQEMTEIFLYTLKSAVKSPNLPIRTQNIDPEPLPKGKPYTKYKFIKELDDYKKKIEDWLKK